jgi:hypothetical protein
VTCAWQPARRRSTPACTQNQLVNLCAVALDPTPMVRGKSNVATFTIL